MREREFTVNAGSHPPVFPNGPGRLPRAEMRNTPWSRLEAVGDQSGYVNVLISSVKETIGEILVLTGKETYQRAFRDKVVEAMATGF